MTAARQFFLSETAMIQSASRGIIRPVLGPGKTQIKSVPSLVKSIPSTRRGALRLCVAMAASPIIEAYVKGNPTTHERGDCPFSHRALLTLAEKHLPYKEEYIDFNDKPKWLFDINPEGSVPIIHDLEKDKWVPDSAAIVDYLEDRFPEVALGKHDAPPQVGGQLFPSFVAALKAKKGTDEESKKIGVLVQSLEEINNYLRDNDTPYLGGESPNQADLGIAPKLYHVEIAMREYKGWDIPDELSALKDYNQRIRGRESWKQTYYPPEKIIQGWKAKVEG